MTRSSHELCLADFSAADILGLFDRADEIAGGAPPLINRTSPAPGPSEPELTAESWQVLQALHRLRRDGQALEELTVAWVGAATADLHAWLEAASILGITLRMAVPDGYEPDAGLFLACEGRAPGRLVRCRDEAAARAGATLVLTPALPTEPASPPIDAGDLAAALTEFLAARARGRVDFRALLNSIHE